MQILGVFTQGAAIGARLIAALEQAAAQTCDPRELLEARAAAESWQAMIVFRLGRIDAMVQHAQRAVALAEHQQARQLLEQVGSARDSRIAALRAGYALARAGQFAAGSAQLRANLGWFWGAQILPNVLEGLALLADLLQSQADADRPRMLQWLTLVQAHPATPPETRTWARRAFRAGSAQLPPEQVPAIRAAGAVTPIDAIMRESGYGSAMPTAE